MESGETCVMHGFAFFCPFFGSAILLKGGSACDCRTYGSFRDQGQADRAQCLAHDQDAEETYSPFPENVKKQRAAQGVVADSFGT